MAYYRLPEKELRAYCEAVMGKYGFNEKQSRDIADILLTADHGGHGRGHGSDCPEDMTIPLVMNGPRRAASDPLPPRCEKRRDPPGRRAGDRA